MVQRELNVPKTEELLINPATDSAGSLIIINGEAAKQVEAPGHSGITLDSNRSLTQRIRYS